MSRLIVVRHAEPDEGARGRCYGSLDVGLSNLGRRQAVALAERLARFDYTAVYASPRARAVDTATPIAGAHGLTVHVDGDLRELDFGELEGRTYDEIAAVEPELYRAWMERPTTVIFPGGESFAALKRRTVAAVDRIRTSQPSAVIVTHGGVIRAALAAWLAMADEAIFRLDQRYCGVTIVEWVDGIPIIRLMNGEV